MLMPSTTVEQVQDMLNEFVRVNLIVLWEESGTTWGYFTGMEKPGRLPSASQLARYGTLPPNPPAMLAEVKQRSSNVLDVVSENVKHSPNQFTTTLEIGAGLGEHVGYETLTTLQKKKNSLIRRLFSYNQIF